MTRSNVDVVVCVHNALEDVKHCLRALAKTTYDGALRFVIVDDGSSATTARYLQRFAEQEPRAHLLRREEASGYTVAANTGLADTSAELVVLLNSDTIVPPLWLDKMVRVFECCPDVGIVGPLSNAASWQSVPLRSAPEGGWAINALPEGVDVAGMDDMVARVAQSIPVTVRVPLLNGFCLGIRRGLLSSVGDFDALGFPFGFGEEDDFCLRAANQGYGLALACDTYVFHAKSKSYGSLRREKLTAAGQEKLRLKHSAGRLHRALSTMTSNPYLRMMRDGLAAELADRGLT